MRILIIDDDESISLALETALSFEGYSTKVVTHAKKSLAAAKSFKPDIILLDYLLSGTDGSIVAEVLKKDRITQKIPIIFMSAHPTAQVIAQKTGIEGFLAKPFDIATLTKTIQSLMRE